MGVPSFIIKVTPTHVPLNGELIVDAIPSEPLRGYPDITVDMATLVAGPMYQPWGAYRAVFVVRGYNNGLVRVRGFSYEDGLEGASLVSGAFTLGAGVPVGVEGVGWSPPGVSLEFAPGMAASDVLAAFNFRVERGYEGPQVVCKWDNPTNEPLLLVVRTEFAWPEDADGTFGNSFAFPMIYGVTSFADVWCQDGVMYYYGLYRVNLGSGDPLLECLGHGAIFPIDNRPTVELVPQTPVLDVVGTLPMAPVDGDRYLLDASHPESPKIATYTGGAWVYEMPSRRWSVVSPLCTSPLMRSIFNTLAFPTTWCFREFGAYLQDLTGSPGLWCPFVDKERLDLYSFLDLFDRAQDSKSVTKALSTQTLEELEFDERFNFETDPGMMQPAAKRFLKLFTLPIGTAKGLIDWQRNSLMRVNTTDLRLVPNIGALVGYEHYDALPVSLQRFLVLNLSHFYPILGRWDEIGRAFRNWLGPGYDFNLKPFASNVAYMNEAMFAVVTPSPEETGTELDCGFYMTHTDPENVHHFKGVELFADINPFLVTSMADPELGPSEFRPKLTPTRRGAFWTVVSATQTTEPTIDQVGQLFLVPVGADPGWARFERAVVFVFDVGVYFPCWPWDYEGIVAEDTGHLWVFRQTWLGDPLDPQTHGEWFELPGLQQFYALQWWLQCYGAPGTLHMEFRDRPFPPMSLVDDLRSWPNGPVTSVTSKHGWWSDTVPPISLPPVIPFDKHEIMGVHYLRGGVPDLPSGWSPGSSPSLLQGVFDFACAGYGHRRFEFTLDFVLPVGFPGPTMLGAVPVGDTAFYCPISLACRVDNFGFSNGLAMLTAVTSGGVCSFVFTVGPIPGGSFPGSYQIIPVGALADGNPHTLFVAWDLDDQLISATIDGIYGIEHPVVSTGVPNGIAIVSWGGRTWVGAPLVNDIPPWDFTNLEISVD
jgi:hypothetical protein